MGQDMESAKISLKYSDQVGAIHSEREHKRGRLDICEFPFRYWAWHDYEISIRVEEPVVTVYRSRDCKIGLD